MEQNNPNVTNLDEYQMANRSFDGNKDAVRVSVVDGITLNVDRIDLPAFEFPKSQEIVIKEIHIPQIIKELEVRIVEVPVIVKEIQIERVEIPVIIEKTQIIEIEKPIVIKETEVKVIEKQINELPMFAKVCMVIQTAALLGLMLANLLK